MNEKVLDYGATGAGGVSGVDLIYMAVEGAMKDGIDLADGKLLVYGLIALVTGFFAWRKKKHESEASNPA